MSELQDNIRLAAEAISQASALLITAGAGMGVDSGLPDFRGNSGFWRAYPALKGYPFEEMANPKWFVSDPTRAWGFYGHRLNLYRKTVPHAGFEILIKWSKHIPAFVYTSNVDGQFQKAGFSEDKIVECHGSIHHFQHLNTIKHGDEIWSAEGYNIDVDMSTVRAKAPLPKRDKQILRPNILMFGDWGWCDDRTNEQYNNFEQWQNDTDMTHLVIVEMGAGTAIPSVRNLSRRFKEKGGTLIRINPRESHDATIPLELGAKDALMAIDGEL